MDEIEFVYPVGSVNQQRQMRILFTVVQIIEMRGCKVRDCAARAGFLFHTL